MAEGAGKYDYEATMVRLSTKAVGVMVIVFGGDRGHGFSMQSDNPKFLKAVPDILRSMADQIEQDMKNMS